MTLTANEEFNQSLAGPTTTIFIDPLDEGEKNFTSDVADVLTPGIAATVTATTQANDVTPATAKYGDSAQEGGPVYGIDIEGYSPDFPSEHYHAPNTSVTKTDYTKGANRPLKGRRLKKGMKLWMLMSFDATGVATRGEILIFADDGLLARVGTPSGSTIDTTAFAFRCLATIASQNWVPVECIERTTVDNST